eukprot:617340_1
MEKLETSHGTPVIESFEHPLIALISGTIGMIDFIYPALAFISLVPGDYSTLWTRTCDAIFYVPLIIPLIRYLDKMECFSLQKVTRDRDIDSETFNLKEEPQFISI